MKVIDKTPLQDEKGEISRFQRVRGTLEYGLGWYAEMEAQKAVMAQLDQILEKGFTLIRNITLGNSSITEPLVLVGPPGIYVLYVTPLAGFYEAKGDQWNVIKSGHSYPTSKNLMSFVWRLSRALQVYLNRQGVNLPGPVEPVLVSTNPAMHVDSLRPMVRVVLSDAVRQFAASLLQARPVLPLLGYLPVGVAAGEDERYAIRVERFAQREHPLAADVDVEQGRVIVAGRGQLAGLGHVRRRADDREAELAEDIHGEWANHRRILDDEDGAAHPRSASSGRT